MRCKKCGRTVGLITKFCPKCGTAVTAEQKKKGLIVFGIWVLVYLLLIPAVYYFARKYYPETQTLPLKDNLLRYSGVALIIWAVIFWIYFFISALIRLIIRRPVVGSLILVFILGLTGVSLYFYNQDAKTKAFNNSLNLLQDSLNEVAAAKIMGDTIIAKKAVPGVSLERVKAAGKMIENRLEFTAVVDELYGYRVSIINWSKAVAEAADDTKKWKSLASQPDDFQIKISRGLAETLFNDSMKKITELKEFGDSAIQRKDKVTMVYVAAKLLTQKHWLNGLENSRQAGLLSFEIFSSPVEAQAAGISVPDIGPSGPVPCQQVCAQIQLEKDAAYRQKLWNMYGCNSCGQTTQPTQPINQQQQQNQQTNQNQNQTQSNQNQNQTNQKTNNQTTPNTNAGNQNQNQGNTSSQSNDSGAGSPNSKNNKICIGRGGTATRTNGSADTNVYCIEDAVQSVNEIESSAIGFTQGDKKAGDNWDSNWHNLEGAGITVGAPTNNSAGRSPSVQAFYDGCQGKGGIVGGAGTVKTGLPTTESGYTCEYKIKDKNGASIPCWDFLTYSGSRYLGGNNGCEERNLLPEFDEDMIKDKTATLGGRYDGDYGHSAGTIVCSGDFAYSIPIAAGSASIRNNILNTTAGPIPLNGNTVVYPLSVTQALGENGHLSINEIDTFVVSEGGFFASYAGTITATQDDQVKVSSCYGTVSGGRIK